MWGNEEMFLVLKGKTTVKSRLLVSVALADIPVFFTSGSTRFSSIYYYIFTILKNAEFQFPSALSVRCIKYVVNVKLNLYKLSKPTRIGQRLLADRITFLPNYYYYYYFRENFKVGMRVWLG
jgi:hypothetical protein